jgi:hypothetical protein
VSEGASERGSKRAKEQARGRKENEAQVSLSLKISFLLRVGWGRQMVVGLFGIYCSHQVLNRFPENSQKVPNVLNICSPIYFQ